LYLGSAASVEVRIDSVRIRESLLMVTAFII
jgi:hypothetical protein